MTREGHSDDDSDRAGGSIVAARSDPLPRDRPGAGGFFPPADVLVSDEDVTVHMDVPGRIEIGGREASEEPKHVEGGTA